VRPGEGGSGGTMDPTSTCTQLQVASKGSQHVRAANKQACACTPPPHTHPNTHTLSTQAWKTSLAFANCSTAAPRVCCRKPSEVCALPMHHCASVRSGSTSRAWLSLVMAWGLGGGMMMKLRGVGHRPGTRVQQPRPQMHQSSASMQTAVTSTPPTPPSRQPPTSSMYWTASSPWR
jgi:hypothetical protein